jgi:type I restriction enzyme M protein
MRKSLGSKRKEMSDEHIAQVTKMFGDFVEANLVTVVDADGKEIQPPGADGRRDTARRAGRWQGEDPLSRIFRNEEFGYRTITVERPAARREAGKLILGEQGQAQRQAAADSSLRDTENVPLSEDVDTYFRREVLPHAPDAWIDHEKTKVGYEIPFNRHFYVFEPPRELAEIDTDLKKVTDRIKAMIEGLSA